MERPVYEALDAQGKPYERPARVIGELPTTAARAAALESATQAIAGVLGAAAVRCIPFGAPAYEAFGMTRARAKAHQHADILLMHGDQLPLTLCLEFDEEAPATGRCATV